MAGFVTYQERVKEMLRRGFEANGSFFERNGEHGYVHQSEIMTFPPHEFEKWVNSFPISENLYSIRRSCMWFCASEEIYHSKMREYFTEKAISSLLKDGMIVIKKTD